MNKVFKTSSWASPTLRHMVAPHVVPTTGGYSKPGRPYAIWSRRTWCLPRAALRFFSAGSSSSPSRLFGEWRATRCNELPESRTLCAVRVSAPPVSPPLAGAAGRSRGGLQHRRLAVHYALAPVRTSGEWLGGLPACCGRHGLADGTSCPVPGGALRELLFVSMPLTAVAGARLGYHFGIGSESLDSRAQPRDGLAEF